MSSVVAFLTALPAFIRSLPDLCKLGLKMIALMERFSAYTKERGLNDWIDRVEQTMDEVDNAKTSQERRNAARSIIGIIRDIK